MIPVTRHACERYAEYVLGRDPATLTDCDHNAIRALLQGQWHKRKHLRSAREGRYYRLADCVAVLPYKGRCMVTVTTMQRFLDAERWKGIPKHNGGRAR